MKFVLDIELGNEAMQRAPDVLEAITRSLEREHRFRDLGPDWWGTITDANGNTVGGWKVVES